jgi:phage terminase small subunit
MSENVRPVSEKLPEMSELRTSGADLTPRQALFVQEYLIDLNATRAAIRSGYSEKSAERQGIRLTGHDRVKAEIAKAMGERSKRTNITSDMVLEELAKMAFANIADFMVIQPDGSAYVDLSKASKEQLAALTEIQVDEIVEGKGAAARNIRRIKIKMSDKKANLELLGRHLGTWKADEEDDGDAKVVLMLQGCDGAKIQVNAGNKVFSLKDAKA